MCTIYELLISSQLGLRRYAYARIRYVSRYRFLNTILYKRLKNERNFMKYIGNFKIIKVTNMHINFMSIFKKV